MIKLSIDEGAAFDMYSILRIKLSKVVSAQTLSSINLMQTEIKDAIGAASFTEILSSEQYAQLIETNAKLFELIDEIKKQGRQDPVDQLNYQRYQGKGAIQAAFFDTPLTETKIGYDKVGGQS